MPPDHKMNFFNVQIQGNFKDSKDSFYSFTKKDFVHITFVKREDGSIWEEVRELIFMDVLEQFFPAENPELIYKSFYKTVRGYRAFLKRQPLFDEHKLMLIKYGSFIATNPAGYMDDYLPF